MRTKAVVTGGAGFIGSHLVERLLDQEVEVIILDNFSTGRESNLKTFREHPDLRVQRADVSDLSAIEAVFTDVNWVFHLAALADIVPSITQPTAYHDANVNGTLAVLEASRRAGVQRFIYAASSSCYGLATQFPTPESAMISPQYPYALTKWVGECYVQHWYQVYQLPTTCLRLFNVYGPRARTSGTYGAVFGVFLAQKLAGKPLTVVGDGSQTRDFTYVTDVAEAFIAAARSSRVGSIYNVGSGGTYSIRSLAESLGGELTFLPKRPGEPDCTFADIRRIQEELKWSPQVDFQEGVHCMLEHIEDWREAPVWNRESIAEATKEWFAHLGESSSVSVG